MTERIRKLTEMTLAGEMYVNPVAVSFDREDILTRRKGTSSACANI